MANFRLDGFEAGSILKVQPNSPQPRDRDLWNLYTDLDFIAGVPLPGLSTTDVVTTNPHSGTYCLHNRFNQDVHLTGLPPTDYGSNWQFAYHTYCVSLPGFVDGWKFLYELAQGTPPSSYTLGHTNRLKFWMKIPTGADTEPLAPNGDGRHNLEIGTHLKELSEPSYVQESNNWHFYHFFNVAPTSGEWEQFIVDTHPQAQRSWPGDTDFPDELHISSATPSLTYYDLMTRFYIDYWDKSTILRPWPSPTDFYMDDFELYEETFNENITQVASIHGVYLPGSNKVRVGWHRVKAEESVAFDIKYSFSSIYTSGWAAATAAPNSPVTPLVGSGPYGCMHWEETSINVSGHSSIFIGIKPQNSALFRQIEIPVSGSSTPALGLTKPADVTLLSQSGLPVIYTFSDPVANGGTAPYTIVNVPPSGSTFPLGANRIDSTVTDAVASTATTFWTVTVNPPAAPTITCPANITAHSPDGSPIAITFTPTTSGGATPIRVTSIPVSGSLFAVGVTAVQCTVTDNIGRAASCSFLITVIDDSGGGTGTGPTAPANPFPANNATKVNGNSLTLSWAASSGTAPITYDVFFSQNGIPPQTVATNITQTSFRLPKLQKGNKIYHWQVAAKNAFGTTVGPVWTFTTR